MMASGVTNLWFALLEVGDPPVHIFLGVIGVLYGIVSLWFALLQEE